ncbi:MAG: ABC transporter substrate-binding protein [Crocinitomicaceae bacterium]|jgi:ABC-type nitrate/sulfonate/bicarbonate transport system substrate-binding protein
MKRFKIGGVPEHFNLPWRNAIEDGKFQALGVELHWSDMTGGTGQMIKGLQAGTIDIAVLLTEGITKAILTGLDAKILNVYVASPLCWGVHVPSDKSIQSVTELNGKTFAISREGSGSHLMAFVKAKKEHWDLNALKFNVVGDVYGGIWALNHGEAQGFLWEKYTTSPFVDQGKCRLLDEVFTPWPCFVIAVKSSLLQSDKDLLHSIVSIVQKEAFKLKNEPNSAEQFSWRYALPLEKVRAWLSETEWNYGKELNQSAFEVVVSELESLGLIDKKDSEHWEQKLF